MIKLKDLLMEKTVRLSTMKDANFEPGKFVQLLGRKGMVKLDKNSVKFLAKWIRSHSGKHGMGWSFTEGKLKESFQKRHFLNLIKKEIDSLKGQIAYSKDKVNYKGTPDWEKKEFKAVLKDKIKDLKELIARQKRVSKWKVSEVKLSEDFGMAARQLPSFSSPEAKKIVDDGLRLWAKEMRKVQYKIIKDWMSKAKSGAFDYFDLVRGIQTGDASRAHPYETKFLHKLLNKDKIMNRFRSYFGGKKGIKRGK